MRSLSKVALITTSIGCTVLFLLGVALAVQSQQPAELPAYLLGGQTTIFDTTPNAFSQPAPGIEREQNLLFFVGNSFFNQNWVMAPSSTTARDGLGPFFNSRSCAGCHFKDGRGRAPQTPGETSTGLLFRLSIPERDSHHANLPDPVYGGQFQERAIDGVLPEGDIQIEYTEIPGTFADGRPYTLRQPHYTLANLNYGALAADVMISPRVANQMIGLGLLEAIPEATLLALADPDDANGDGISGRSNTVWDEVNQQFAIGRFGWKANQPTILQQVAEAFNGDIGITTSILPAQNCSAAQELLCSQVLNGGVPEIEDDDLLKVVLYASVLAVPAQRDYDDPQVLRGETIFYAAQCQSCHVPTLQTGTHPTISALSDQTIHPYTDLLLHDMGAGLADHRPDFDATGTEWRTPPLWGIGLVETVNGHTNFLHDGRARNLLEAVLWHDGEARASRDYVLSLNETDVDALLAFLRSL
jgi:CxxC motif-containing protein (DUF1111 family)